MCQNGMHGILQFEKLLVQSFIMPYESFEQYVIGEKIPTKRILKTYLKFMMYLMVCVKYGILMFYRPKWLIVATGEYMQEFHDLKIMAIMCFVVVTTFFLGHVMLIVMLKWRKVKIFEILHYIEHHPANCGPGMAKVGDSREGV